VRRGYGTGEAGARDYGMVLVGDDLVIDEAGTMKKRAQHRAELVNGRYGGRFLGKAEVPGRRNPFHCDLNSSRWRPALRWRAGSDDVWQDVGACATPGA
jgi:hypothetical protein